MTQALNPENGSLAPRTEHCPNCAAIVPIHRSRTHPGVLKEFIQTIVGPGNRPGISTQIDAAVEVACPGCGTRFKSSKIKLLGFLSPNQLRIALATMFAGLIGVVVLTLINDFSK